MLPGVVFLNFLRVIVGFLELMALFKPATFVIGNPGFMPVGGSLDHSGNFRSIWKLGLTCNGRGCAYFFVPGTKISPFLLIRLLPSD